MIEMQERRPAMGESFRSGQAQGPPLELTLATGSVYPFEGRLRFADNQVDVKTGTIRVVGEFPNRQKLLVPGMFTRVRAILDVEKGALLVPQRAVTDMQGRSLIAVVDANNKVHIRPVTVGERVETQWVIKDDVKAGDRVVAEGIQKVRDGAVVKPVPAETKEATPPETSPTGRK
jgi:membrane fusion protein (multidrug efflux system)